jgi:tetratricopeptide (TPR) repeat protein
MTDADFTDIFDEYTSGRLSGDALKDIEARLQADPDFNDEFERYKIAVEGISEFERERLRQLIKSRKTIYFRPHYPARIMVTAAIILLLLVPSYIIYRTTTFTGRIISEYHTDDPGLPVTMGSVSDTGLMKAMNEYKDDQFDKALPLLDELLKEKPLNDTLNYYAGLCFFEMDSTSKAIACYLKVVSERSPYYYRAKYNLGLAYVKNNDFDQAMSVFNVVAKSDSDLKDKAAAILEAL